MMMSFLTQRQSTQANSSDVPTLSFDLSEQCNSCPEVLSSPNTGCTSGFMNGFGSCLYHLTPSLTRHNELPRLVSGTVPPCFRSTPQYADECPASASTTSGIHNGNDVITVDPITVDELASSFDIVSAVSGTSCHRLPVAVIVDCRGFVAFNANHVMSAFNASCGDRFARKRLLEGKTTVADLVSGGPEGLSGAHARDRYRRLVKSAVADGTAIVAYDDNSTNLATLQMTHPLKMITECLKKTGATVKFLSGGLQAFHSAYPLLCSKPTDPPSAPLIFSPTTPVVEMDVDSAEIAEILPHLFIGNQRDCADRQLLEKYKINHILNVTSNIPVHFENDDDIKYKRLQASDSGCQNLKQYFEEAIEFIESARCSGGRVLVHCQAGVSRSPTVVIAYLMARFKWTMMTAFQFVKSRRSVVAPNFNFMGQLMDFEERCLCDKLSHCLRDDVRPKSPGLHVIDCGPQSF